MFDKLAGAPVHVLRASISVNVVRVNEADPAHWRGEYAHAYEFVNDNRQTGKEPWAGFTSA